jgi:hypothetical protein
MDTTTTEVKRALRLLQSQRRASKTYYERHKEEIKSKTMTYWELNRDAINLRRRQRYAETHPPKVTSEGGNQEPT